MAKLLLTDEENKLPFAHWDDATLGKAVKYAACLFCEGKEDSPSFNDVLAMRAAASILAAFADSTNSEDMTVIVEGLRDTNTGRERGTWVVNVTKDWAADTFADKKFSVTSDGTTLQSNSPNEILKKINTSDKVTSLTITIEDD
ncbi:MAG: hypothetical protein HC836_31270 [Richelia sp. RM2_1_2]|nr:hypothetical protein [Richelia sp. RM2_1_2]